MTNPFNRADKHGAPDMRPTSPPSAETPMQPPNCAEHQIALDHRTRQRDEEIDRNFKIGKRMVELEAINVELLAALETIGNDDCLEDCPDIVENLPFGAESNCDCNERIARAAIAKAKGG